MVARSRAKALSIQKYRSQPFFHYYELPCKMFKFNILGPTCIYMWCATKVWRKQNEQAISSHQSIMFTPRTPIPENATCHGWYVPTAAAFWPAKYGGAVKLLPGWAFCVCLSQAFPKVFEAVLKASICRNTLQWMMGCETKIIQNGWMQRTAHLIKLN